MRDLSSEIRQFCSGNNLRLNTDLGQHFLIDQDVLDAIIEAAKIEPGDHIVEIGPGIGVLTRELLKRTKNITAIELDEKLIELLLKFTTLQSDQVIHANALQVPMPEEPYTIVANIPYHITSPLLRHVFLESKVSPKSITLLIQKEVADRICDTESAGMLTIIVGLFGTPKKICNVPPASFLPPPKVDSAVLHVQCFEKPLASEEIIDQVMKLTKIGFSQKRKMLRNSFGTFPGGLELLKGVGIDEKRRSQTLSIEEWIALAEAVAQN